MNSIENKCKKLMPMRDDSGTMENAPQNLRAEFTRLPEAAVFAWTKFDFMHHAVQSNGIWMAKHICSQKMLTSVDNTSNEMRKLLLHA